MLSIQNKLSEAVGMDKVSTLRRYRCTVFLSIIFQRRRFFIRIITTLLLFLS